MIVISEADWAIIFHAVEEALDSYKAKGDAGDKDAAQRAWLLANLSLRLAASVAHAKGESAWN